MDNLRENKMPCHTWNYDNFCPWGDEFDGCPYISRIEPGETDIAFEWHDPVTAAGGYMLHYSLRGSKQNNSLELKPGNAVISGLDSGSDYEFFVTASDGRHSKTRIARTGEYRGKVVDYLHPEDEAYAFSGRYLCSPSLVRAPDGRLLASCDVYSNGAGLP